MYEPQCIRYMVSEHGNGLKADGATVVGKGDMDYGFACGGIMKEYDNAPKKPREK